MHQAMAATLETGRSSEIRAIQKEAREHGFTQAPRLAHDRAESPKGWTGPKVVDGVQIEGTFRAHQVPLDRSGRPSPTHLKMLEDWMKSYRPEELFDEHGTLGAGIARSWRPRASGAWARIRTPTAACCCSDLQHARFPRLRRDRSQARQRRSPKPRACWATCCAT